MGGGSRGRIAGGEKINSVKLLLKLFFEGSSPKLF
jgi:hypothetical protein